ncbi:hypothetical protein EMIHUDRAFT_458498 [Emiliania huxleyi CCMP1516]|uniref:Gfo/Idh/MocA-like oxidoreductase N-terminal domain-containing protein n=2 Tax=Emiliania huxleyi TaxID=2903 RepID=A0A0D3JBD9_EMIH1|nr:hypothetical protein EMIHUDRAFT_458498 [Emiliania huxleyi CCMP1516]EOD20824.1 hypothetical protein EMIHUDRAFT_458498 [Emiliania huxleyi CCMP1516]|eukprot:XP_005773253.1 hypothetical protein EMIHUDRAFT_458498 [Emiliania huxleyi CCMP1516]
MSQRKARIAVLGAGWWSQGWHLPHLSRHSEAEIVAIVEPNPHPRSAINELESTAALGERYGCPVFSSLADALASPLRLDGLLVCTSHASHFELGIAGLRAGLHGLAFLINNTANYRAQSRAAAALVRERRRVGRVQHVQCCMHSALLWLFDDPSNEGWTRSTGRMSGNGFGWGQLSHLLAFVFHAAGGQLGKYVSARFFGDEARPDTAPPSGLNPHWIRDSGGMVWYQGMAVYEGLSRRAGGLDADDEAAGSARRAGTGPESLCSFVDACLGREHYVGAGAEVGLAVVRAIDAMYRSARSGRLEACAPGEGAGIVGVFGVEADKWV